MARFPRQAAAAAALLAVLLIGGCSTTVVGIPAADPAPQPTAGPGSDPVAWVDRACGSLLSFYQPLKAVPKFPDNLPLNENKQLLSDYLGKVLGGITAGQQQLGAAGPSPVSGGDQFAKAIGDLLDRSGKTIGEAKADVDTADTKNQDTYTAGLNKAKEKLVTIGPAQGLDKLGATPRLDKAFAAAPKCVEFKQLNPPAPAPGPAPAPPR